MSQASPGTSGGSLAKMPRVSLLHPLRKTSRGCTETLTLTLKPMRIVDAPLAAPSASRHLFRYGFSLLVIVAFRGMICQGLAGGAPSSPHEVDESLYTVHSKFELACPNQVCVVAD